MKNVKNSKTNDELRQMDLASLKAYVKEMEDKLFTIRYEVRSGQAKESHLVKAYKKAVAQGKTAMNAQEAKAAPTAEAKTPEKTNQEA